MTRAGDTPAKLAEQTSVRIIQAKHGCHDRADFPANFRMERNCQYTLSLAGATDPACEGCKWKRQ